MTIGQVNQIKQPALLFLAISLGMFVFRMALPMMLPLSIMMLIVSIAYILVNEYDLFTKSLKQRNTSFIKLSWLLLLILPFTWGLILSDSALWPTLLKEGFNFFYLFVIFIIAILVSKQDDSGDVFLIYICWCFFVLGVLSGVLGFTKLMHWMYGHKWTFFFDDWSYPAGTSMSGDYNFYSLSCIIALVSGAYLFQKGELGKNYFGYMFILSIAIVLSGSRRSLLLFPLFTTISVLLIAYKSKGMILIQRIIAGLIIMLLAPTIISIYFFGMNPVHKNEMAKALHMKSKVVKTEMSKLSFRYLTILQPKANYREFFKENWYVKDGTTIVLPGYKIPDEEKTTYGSRIERWKYAFSLFTNKFSYSQKVLGNGFNYMSNYANRFNLLWKTPYDYPHNPVLAALLYGGLIGMVFLIAYFVYWSFVMFRNFQSLLVLFWMAVSSMVYILSSGNTIFSIPLTVFLLLFPLFYNHVHER